MTDGDQYAGRFAEKAYIFVGAAGRQSIDEGGVFFVIDMQVGNTPKLHGFWNFFTRQDEIGSGVLEVGARY